MSNLITTKTEAFFFQERSSWIFKIAFGSATVLCLGGAILIGLNFSLATDAALICIAFLTVWVAKKLRDYSQEHFHQHPTNRTRKTGSIDAAG